MKFWAMLEMAYTVGSVHTGANLHGGNPTIFGQWEPMPVWGWIIGLSWLLVVPWLHSIGQMVELARYERWVRRHGHIGDM